MIHIAYQDFVIVLPGVVNNLPQYLKDFCFGQECTKCDSQIAIDNPPVEDLQRTDNRDTFI